VERVLDGIGIPVGSELSHEGLCRPVGKLQGLALYLNGTELAAKYYADPVMITKDNLASAGDVTFAFNPAQN